MVEGKIYLSSPADFNDPFDCAPVNPFFRTDMLRAISDGRLTSERPAPSLLRGRPDAGDRLRRAIALDAAFQSALRQITNSVGISCFTGDPTNILMWSHYADCHKGVCIAFSSEEHEKIVVKAKNALRFDRLFRVTYSGRRPSALTPFDRRGDGFENMFLSKAKSWSYEQEWRIVDDRGPGVYGFDPSRVVALILGACIDSETRSKVLDCTKERESPLVIYQARLNSSEYIIETRLYGEHNPRAELSL